MLDARADIRQNARRHRRAHVPADSRGFLVEVFFAERETEQATDFSVNHPMSLLIILFRLEEHWAKLSFGRRKIVPRMRTLNHMSIGIYPSHNSISSRSDQSAAIGCLCLHAARPMPSEAPPHHSPGSSAQSQSYSDRKANTTRYRPDRRVARLSLECVSKRCARSFVSLVPSAVLRSSWRREPKY